MKLWVLPLSIKIHTPWLEIRPTTLRVSGAIWPNKAWRLIWVGDESSIGSMGTGFRVVREVSRDSSSSSTTNKNNPEEHLWPRVNFSSQLKHNPFSRRRESSSGERCLKGMDGDGGLEGMESRDAEEMGRGGWGPSGPVVGRGGL